MIFLAQNFQVRQPWRGHLATVGFEVIATDETSVGFCSFDIARGDNQLGMLHAGALHCETADSAHPWEYSDQTYPWYSCINRLDTSATVLVNPTSSSVVPISGATWGALKGLFQ